MEGFLEDFYRLYQYIHEVTGEYPALFRFPGGSINGYDRGVYQEIIAEMTRRGFVYFDWNASAQDATLTQEYFVYFKSSQRGPAEKDVPGWRFDRF